MSYNRITEIEKAVIETARINFFVETLKKNQMFNEYGKDISWGLSGWLIALERNLPGKDSTWIFEMLDKAMDARLLHFMILKNSEGNEYITIHFSTEDDRINVCKMIGHKILEDRFIADIKDLCTELVKKDKNFAIDLWGSIANVDWIMPGTTDAGLSFRRIAGIIAEMRGDGTDYMDWYMCTRDGYARDNVKAVLLKRGWSPIEEFDLEEDDDFLKDD